MPRGDGTGPMGMGPMTGRAAGFCAGYAVPGYMNPVQGRGRGMAWGRGYGRGFGMGMAWRHGWAAYHSPFYPTPYYPANFPQSEEEILKKQAEYLGKELEQINKRIEELEAGKIK